MTNDALRIKVRERFNKLSSQDYENLEDWQILEAFHKAQLGWVRSQLAGKNPGREVDEGSKQITDELNILLKTVPLELTSQEQGLFFEAPLPKDYEAFKRLSAQAKNDCCPARRLRISPCEVANVDVYLRDETQRPSFEWAETFYTLASDRVQLYVDNQFDIVEASLHYYQTPPCPQIEGVLHLQTGKESTTTVESVFSDAVTEVILDKTVQILAGDTENATQYQRASADVAAAS